MVVSDDDVLRLVINRILKHVFILCFHEESNKEGKFYING